MSSEVKVSDVFKGVLEEGKSNKQLKWNKTLGFVFDSQNYV